MFDHVKETAQECRMLFGDKAHVAENARLAMNMRLDEIDRIMTELLDERAKIETALGYRHVPPSEYETSAAFGPFGPFPD
jgi:hypothetical protein